MARERPERRKSEDVLRARLAHWAELIKGWQDELDEVGTSPPQRALLSAGIGEVGELYATEMLLLKG